MIHLLAVHSDWLHPLDSTQLSNEESIMKLQMKPQFDDVLQLNLYVQQRSGARVAWLLTLLTNYLSIR